jgi:hypothetical protein
LGRPGIGRKGPRHVMKCNVMMADSCKNERHVNNASCIHRCQHSVTTLRLCTLVRERAEPAVLANTVSQVRRADDTRLRISTLGLFAIETEYCPLLETRGYEAATSQIHGRHVEHRHNQGCSQANTYNHPSRDRASLALATLRIDIEPCPPVTWPSFPGSTTPSVLS